MLGVAADAAGEPVEVASMKSSSPFPLLVLVGLTGGIAGGAAGVAVALLLGSPSADAPRRVVPRHTAPAQDAALVARVVGLEEQGRALQEQLARLEALQVAASRAPAEPAVSPEDLEALRAELESALAGAAAPPSTDLEAQVADALTTIRREERAEAYRGQHERRLERLDEVLPQLEQRLGLTRYQTSRMRTALESRYEREAELLSLWQGGAGDEVVGQQKQADSDAFRDELASFLTEDQLQSFWSGGGESGK
jgi:hypothetical protein